MSYAITILPFISPMGIVDKSSSKDNGRYRRIKKPAPWIEQAINKH